MKIFYNYKIKETHESVRVLWYNGRIAGIILRINGFCVHCRNPALISSTPRS